MTKFLLNQTESYTLVASTETGNARLVLADDLAEKLADAVAGDASPEAALASLLDVLGPDAPEYLAAMGELAGVGDAYSKAYAAGDMAGLSKALASAGSDGTWLDPDLAKGGDGFDHFTPADASDVANALSWSSPEGGDTFGKEGSDDGAAAVEALFAADHGGHMSGWAAVGWLIAVSGTVVLAGMAYDRYQIEKGKEATKTIADEVDFTPLDPYGENPYGDLMPDFGKPVSPEAVDPTFGQTLPDGPEDILSTDHTRPTSPEEAREQRILTDPDDDARELTAADVAAAHEARIDALILPVDAEDTFDFDFGDDPFGGFGGGEDFSVAASAPVLQADLSGIAVVVPDAAPATDAADIMAADIFDLI